MKKYLLCCLLAAVFLAGCAQTQTQTPPPPDAQPDTVRFLVEVPAGPSAAVLANEPPELVHNLPVDELPREALTLYKAVRQDFWRDTLIPLAWDEAADVTLYGVVEGIPQGMGMQVGPNLFRLDCRGIVLRQGDRAEYAPLDWSGNLFMGANPWLSIADLDGDGQDEAAVCLHSQAGGTGVSVQDLYLFELDTFAWTVPDNSLLEIQAEYCPEDHMVRLTSGDRFLDVSMDGEMEEHLKQDMRIRTGSQIAYSCENGQISYWAALAYGGQRYDSAIIGPVVWTGEGYAWGPVSEMNKPLAKMQVYVEPFIDMLLEDEPPERVYDLPADELPREIVEIGQILKGSYEIPSEYLWENLLFPMAGDDEADVTLYGVYEMKDPSGVVLRQGDEIGYYPIYWGESLRRGCNPELMLADLDGDGEDEVAVLLGAGSGTGVSRTAVYIFDGNSCSVPDCSTLDIWAEYDPEASTLLLTSRELSLEVSVEGYVESVEDIGIGRVVHFSFENGQIRCDAGVSAGLIGVGIADVTAPVVWNGEGYELGPVSELRP